jgi:hypothetical protein
MFVYCISQLLELPIKARDQAMPQISYISCSIVEPVVIEPPAPRLLVKAPREERQAIRSLVSVQMSPRYLGLQTIEIPRMQHIAHLSNEKLVAWELGGRSCLFDPGLDGLPHATLPTGP